MTPAQETAGSVRGRSKLRFRKNPYQRGLHPRHLEQDGARTLDWFRFLILGEEALPYLRTQVKRS